MSKPVFDIPSTVNPVVEQQNKNRKKILDDQLELQDNKLRLEDKAKLCPESDLVKFDKNSEKCVLIGDCPPGFEKSDDQTTCVMYMDDINIYRYKKENKCEEQYIDWITIPNYHLGNKYFKLNTGDNESDFNGCFDPCNNDFIPYNTNQNSPDSIQCIRKSIANIGRYGESTLDYCPLVLIILLSCDSNPLSSKFKSEYIDHKKKKEEIDPQIKQEIKSDNDLFIEMKNKLIDKGREYVITLLNKYETSNFIKDIKITNFELDKCFDTSIEKIGFKEPYKKEVILYAYKIYDELSNENNNINKYVNSYNYNSEELKELHKKLLLWCCKTTFDKNTSYGDKNLKLYEELKDKIEVVIDKNLEYIHKVNKNEIENEFTLFFTWDFLHIGNIFKKLIYKSDEDVVIGKNLIENKYLLGLPSTIILLSIFIIIILIAVLFYKFTKPVYYRLKEILLIIIFNIATIVNNNIHPKIIISNLFANVANQNANPYQYKPN
jgi:hypothetical protein